MKQGWYLLLLLEISSNVLAASRIVTISRFETGKDKWAFNREEVMLSCGKEGALFVINPGTLRQYPLNDKAEALMKERQNQMKPITTIQLDDAKNPGHKMSLQPFITRARQLCASTAK